MLSKSWTALLLRIGTAQKKPNDARVASSSL